MRYLRGTINYGIQMVDFQVMVHFFRCIIVDFPLYQKGTMILIVFGSNENNFMRIYFTYRNVVTWNSTKLIYIV